MSFIGWLDHSEAEQRQVRELLQLFADRGTVDDLGIGTVRDAISNRLFPGTSVIQTRARYFLFIPWIFQQAEMKHRAQIVERAELMERKLIAALLNSESKDKDGLIGKQAGKDVRTLPSAIYWTGLAAYGVFLQPGLTRSQYGRAARSKPPAIDVEDEVDQRSASYWHRDIPKAPDGFFDFTAADLALTRDEAVWLSERVLSTEPRRGPNLLGAYVRYLRAGNDPPNEIFWSEPLPGDIDDETLAIVGHAEMFSTAIHGAALLYNLLLARDRGDAAIGDDELVEARRDDLAAWAAECQALDVASWAADVKPFWDLVTSRSMIPPLTRSFVDKWCALLVSKHGHGIVDDPEAVALVRNRELQHKRAQARFGNPARLREWNGGSGLAPLEYRWTQVRRFLRDLSGGLRPPDGDGVHVPEYIEVIGASD